jgi:hypothetical protein
MAASSLIRNPGFPYQGNGSRGGNTYKAGGKKSEWQGRKDSNLGPSVLETDALTRLSYAPIDLKRAERAGRPHRILADAQRLISVPD